MVTPSSGLVPQSIFAGQFRIVAQLARGGMGTIYQVEQLPTGHPRALKVILPEYAQDPKARARFEQEARIAARIESEHAAQVIAAGVDPETNTPWLAMELLQGRDLSVVLGERGHLPPAEVAEVMKQLGHALSAAHRIGVVHRDLKPENIFIATSRRSDVAFTVKVLDFGVAKWAQESRPGQSTAVVGSPLWMAPEQLDARGVLGPHTDIWAVGLLAYAMLTGRPYWRGAGGESFSLPEVVGEIMAAPIVPASQRATEQGLGGFVPPGFDGWFARCVERDGAMRFRTVDECVGTLLQTLGRARGAADGDARRGAGVVDPGDDGDPRDADAAAGELRDAAARRRSRAARWRGRRGRWGSRRGRRRFRAGRSRPRRGRSAPHHRPRPTGARPRRAPPRTRRRPATARRRGPTARRRGRTGPRRVAATAPRRGASARRSRRCTAPRRGTAGRRRRGVRARRRRGAAGGRASA